MSLRCAAATRPAWPTCCLRTAAPRPVGARSGTPIRRCQERLRRLYGREVLPLAAEMLPPIDEGDDDAPMRIAPALPGGAGPTTGAGPAGATTEVTPEAHRHDALQVPTSFRCRRPRGRGAGAHRALARTGRVAGRDARAGARTARARRRESLAAWREATADLGVAAAVGREVEVLGAPARRRVFELLLQRARAHRWRSGARRGARCFSAGAPAPVSPGMDWRALALGLLLDSRRPIGRRTASSLPLARQAEAADAATRLLATALGATDDASHAWRRAARCRWPRPAPPRRATPPLAWRRQRRGVN